MHLRSHKISMSGFLTSPWLSNKKILDDNLRKQCLFNYVITLNNDAVHFFELRHFEDAKANFREAANKATWLLQELASTGEETFVGKPSHPIHTGWSISPKLHESPESTKHEVFTLFRTILMQTQNITTSSLKACLSILLYNLAVTLHIHVTYHPHHSSEFEYTSKLYEMSLRILKESHYDCDDSLLLCMFNNAGALFFTEMVNYEEAQECFLAVSMLLTLGKRNGMKALLSKAELIEILLNLYIQQVRCAPAA
jgi:hypothetical protein